MALCESVSVFMVVPFCCCCCQSFCERCSSVDDDGGRKA